MMIRLHPRAQELETESAFKVLQRARQLESKGKDIIHLEIGQPDFPTPAPICDKAKEAIDQGHTGYGPTPGLPDLRALIADYAGRQRGVELTGDEVIVTPGAKPLIYYSISALVGPGDEVILPDPAFPTYPSVIKHVGAEIVPLPLKEETGFRFDPDEFLAKITPKTRLVFLNSPHNPTGGVLTQEDLEIVAKAAIENDFVVVSDEIYSRLVYDGKFCSILSIPGMKERTIVIDGFSKTYSMTGWRLGYALLPSELLPTFELYSVNIVSCVSTFSQYGAMEALTMDQTPITEMVNEFQSRRDLLVEHLNAIPSITCQIPKGAFYAFANITQTGKTSQQLAEELLEHAGVALLNGGSFGEAGEGFLRFSYANSKENLIEACKRIRSYLS